MITIIEFREKVIDDGIAEVKEAYADDDVKREGAIDGFWIARTLASRNEFEDELQRRTNHEHELRNAYYDKEQRPSNLDEYWRFSWGTTQIEWVLECLKAAYWAEPGDMLSGRAARKAVEVMATLLARSYDQADI